MGFMGTGVHSQVKCDWQSEEKGQKLFQIFCCESKWICGYCKSSNYQKLKEILWLDGIIVNNSVQKLIHTLHRQEYIEVILRILITESGLRRNTV